jgi:hypothetical protein
MALSYIQMPVDGAGKQVQAWSNALGPGTLYTEAVTITDSTGVEKGTSTNPVRTDPTGTTIQPVSQSGTWTVGISAAQTIAVTQTTAASLNATVTIAAAQTIAVTNTGTFAVQATGTFYQATQPVSIASGQVASGAFASGSIASGAIASGAIASGAIAAGAAAAGAFADGSIYVRSNAASTFPVTATIAASQTIAVTNTGTFATQSTLSAETTKVIGTVNQGTSPWVISGAITVASTTVTGVVEVSPTTAANTVSNVFFTQVSDGSHGVTINSTTYTAKYGLDVNLLGTLGTAFSTAGKIDVICTNAGTFAVTQGTAANFNATVSIAAAQTLSTVTTVSTVTAVTAITNAVKVTGNAGGAFDAATNAAQPANAVQVGMVAATALPPAYTSSNLVPPTTDKFGRQVVVINTVRDLVGFASVQTTDTSSHTIIAAQGSNVYADIVSLAITNESASTATIISFADGTVTYKFALAAGGGIVLQFPSTLPATSTNTAWTATSSGSVNVDFVTTWAKNK